MRLSKGASSSMRVHCPQLHRARRALSYYITMRRSVRPRTRTATQRPGPFAGGGLVPGGRRASVSEPFCGGCDAHGGCVQSRCLSLHSYQLPQVAYQSAEFQKSGPHLRTRDRRAGRETGLREPTILGGCDAHGGCVHSRCLSLHSYQLPRVAYQSAALQKSPKMLKVKVPPRLLHF